MGGQVGAVDSGYVAAHGRAADLAVVVEDGHTVGGEPHVALQGGGAGAQRQGKRLESVAGGVGLPATVGESDRGVAQRLDDPPIFAGPGAGAPSR